MSTAAADQGAAMDATYRGRRHIYDATRKFYLLRPDALIRDVAPPAGGHVVEIGCGTARNLITAARAWPDGRFHGVDFGQQERLPAVWRRALFARLARFDVTPRAALAATLDRIAAERDCTVRFAPLLRGYTWSARVERG